MEAIGHTTGRGHAEADGVQPRHGHVDRITKPLSAAGPTQVDTAARVQRRFQINSVGAIAVIRTIDRKDVEANRLAAHVVVFCLDRAGNWRGNSTEGRFTCR